MKRALDASLVSDTCNLLRELTVRCGGSKMDGKTEEGMVLADGLPSSLAPFSFEEVSRAAQQLVDSCEDAELFVLREDSVVMRWGSVVAKIRYTACGGCSCALFGDHFRHSIVSEARFTRIAGARSENVVEVIASGVFSDFAITITKLCPHGTLETKAIDSITQLYRIWRQLASFLVECHKLGLVHNDLRLKNIFVDAEDVIRVGDFEVSFVMGDKHSLERVTSPLYHSFAPFELRCPGSDVFALSQSMRELAHLNSLRLDPWAVELAKECEVEVAEEEEWKVFPDPALRTSAHEVVARLSKYTMK